MVCALPQQRNILYLCPTVLSSLCRQPPDSLLAYRSWIPMPRIHNIKRRVVNVLEFVDLHVSTNIQTLLSN